MSSWKRFINPELGFIEKQKSYELWMASLMTSIEALFYTIKQASIIFHSMRYQMLIDWWGEMGVQCQVVEQFHSADCMLQGMFIFLYNIIYLLLSFNNPHCEISQWHKKCIFHTKMYFQALSHRDQIWNYIDRRAAIKN